MDWKIIPSLSSLRAFEAVGRLGNQSEAAAALNVTQAAIAQHIRALETDLGSKLFERDGRNLILNPMGRELFDSVHNGFVDIERGIVRARKVDQWDLVRMSVTPSLFERWILPRIQDFWRAYPDIQLDIEPSSKFVDLSHRDFDLALRFGKGHWPPFLAECLMKKDTYVFASKNYAEGFEGGEVDLQQARWIRAKDSPEFFELHEKLSVDFDDPRNLVLPSNSEARAAAIAGLGVLGQDKRFFENELKFGLIEIVKKVELPEELGYYVVRRNEEMRPAVRRVLEWLKETAQTTD